MANNLHVEARVNREVFNLAKIQPLRTRTYALNVRSKDIGAKIHNAVIEQRPESEISALRSQKDLLDQEIKNVIQLRSSVERWLVDHGIEVPPDTDPQHAHIYYR